MDNEVQIRISAEDDTQAAVRSSEGSIERLADTTENASRRMARAGDSADRLGGRVERVGDAADGAETRFTGLASGIDGVTTLMADPSPQEFAQGIADIADGIANSAAPWLGTLRDKLLGTQDAASTTTPSLDGAGDAAESATGKFKGLAQAAGTAGVIGALSGAALALDSWVDSERQADFDSAAEGFETTGDAAALAGEALDYGSGGLGRWADRIVELARTDAPAARAELEAVRAEGEMHPALYDQISASIERLSGGYAAGAQTLRDYADALTAQFDPLFGFMEAQQQVADTQLGVNEAQAALNEAVATYGANSAEAAEAQAALDEATLTASQALVGQQGAMAQLIAGVRDGSINIADAEQRMYDMAVAAGYSDTEARGMAEGFRIAAEDAIALGSTDPNVDVSATDRATPVLQNVGRVVGDIDGMTAHVYAIGHSAGMAAFQFALNNRASGGITGAASGGGRSGLTMVGERGFELLDLPAGTRVTPHQTSKAMLDGSMGGAPSMAGPVIFNFPNYVGSQRDLEEAMYDALSRGALAGALAR